jgi:hypothetical protein
LLRRRGATAGVVSILHRRLTRVVDVLRELAEPGEAVAVTTADPDELALAQRTEGWSGSWAGSLHVRNIHPRAGRSHGHPSALLAAVLDGQLFALVRVLE